MTGSMKGSGIFATTHTFTLTCDNAECEHESVDVDVEVNDFGTFYHTCPVCGYESEYEVSEFTEDDSDRFKDD